MGVLSRFVITLVFVAFMERLTLALIFTSCSSISCRLLGTSEFRIRSSANLKWFSHTSLIIGQYLLYPRLLNMYSSTAERSLGDNRSPCLTSLLIGKCSPILFVRIFAFIFLYVLFINRMY